MSSDQSLICNLKTFSGGSSAQKRALLVTEVAGSHNDRRRIVGTEQHHASWHAKGDDQRAPVDGAADGGCVGDYVEGHGDGVNEEDYQGPQHREHEVLRLPRLWYGLEIRVCQESISDP